jgi:hypothetical protein
MLVLTRNKFKEDAPVIGDSVRACHLYEHSDRATNCWTNATCAASIDCGCCYRRDDVCGVPASRENVATRDYMVLMGDQCSALLKLMFGLGLKSPTAADTIEAFERNTDFAEFLSTYCSIFLIFYNVSSVMLCVLWCGGGG